MHPRLGLQCQARHGGVSAVTALSDQVEVSKQLWALFRSPSNKDHSILGSILGSLFSEPPKCVEKYLDVGRKFAMGETPSYMKLHIAQTFHWTRLHRIRKYGLASGYRTSSERLVVRFLDPI